MTTEIPPQLPSDSPATASWFGTVAAASVMAECLRVQADVRPRSAFARLIGRSPLSADSLPWYQGALGELEVAARLKSLDDGWTVLHSIPVGTRGSDIDHVVLGAAGVFTINAKNHQGARVWVGSRRILVNGQKTDHLRNTRYEAARTQELLSAAIGTEVPVRGVIAIVDAKEVTVREQPDDVAVLGAAQLVRWLKKQKAVLGAAQVADAATAVRTAETWSTVPQPLPSTSGLDALRREVEGARKTRMAWGVAALVTVLAIAMPVAFDYYGRVLGG